MEAAVIQSWGFLDCFGPAGLVLGYTDIFLTHFVSHPWSGRESDTWCVCVCDIFIEGVRDITKGVTIRAGMIYSRRWASVVCWSTGRLA